MRRASENFGAPYGAIMNSCRSTELSACAPPFRIFISGTGSNPASARPRLPSARIISASTVGFPRESRISIPEILAIVTPCSLSVIGSGELSSRSGGGFCPAHDNDPAFGDVISLPAVFLQIEADDARLGKVHTRVNDGPPDAAVAIN